MNQQIDQFLQELNIQTPMINDHLESQAARYAYVGTLAAQATKEASDALLNAKVVTAQLVRATREHFANQGDRAGEWYIRSLVEQDDRYIDAWRACNEAQYRADLLEAIRLGFLQRKDALITIAANLRGEMKGIPRLYEKPSTQASPTYEVPPPSPVKTNTTSGRVQSLVDQFRQQQGSK